MIDAGTGNEIDTVTVGGNTIEPQPDGSYLIPEDSVTADLAVGITVKTATATEYTFGFFPPTATQPNQSATSTVTVKNLYINGVSQSAGAITNTTTFKVSPNAKITFKLEITGTAVPSMSSDGNVYVKLTPNNGVYTIRMFKSAQVVQFTAPLP